MSTLQPAREQSVHVLHRLGTHPVCTGLATGLMLSEVSVAGLLGIRESSSNSLEGCVRQGRDPMGKGSYLGVLSLPTLTQSSLDSPAPPGQCPLPILHLSSVMMGELPQQGMPGGGHGGLYLMLTSCGDTEGAGSRLTCSASVSTGPTCSVSSALVTTVSGGMQGTSRTAGDSTLAGEGSDSHRIGRVP